MCITYCRLHSNAGLQFIMRCSVQKCQSDDRHNICLQKKCFIILWVQIKGALQQFLWSNHYFTPSEPDIFQLFKKPLSTFTTAVCLSLCRPYLLISHGEEEEEDDDEGRRRPPWPPGVRQPENLNEILKASVASVLSAVRWSRQTVGLHDVMPAVLLVLERAGWSADLGRCGLLRH